MTIDIGPNLLGLLHDWSWALAVIGFAWASARFARTEP